MNKFEEFIVKKYPNRSAKVLLHKLQDNDGTWFYAVNEVQDQSEAWQSRQAEVDELQNRLIAVQRLVDEKFALVYDRKGYFSDMVKCDDLDQALKGSHYEEHHTKAEQHINKGARLTKHQIDLGDKNANS